MRGIWTWILVGAVSLLADRAFAWTEEHGDGWSVYGTDDGEHGDEVPWSDAQDTWNDGPETWAPDARPDSDAEWVPPGQDEPDRYQYGRARAIY